jgi:hypothetical protein
MSSLPLCSYFGHFSIQSAKNTIATQTLFTSSTIWWSEMRMHLGYLAKDSMKARVVLENMFHLEAKRIENNTPFSLLDKPSSPSTLTTTVN